MRFGSNFLKYDDEAQNGTTCKNIKDDWIVTARGRPDAWLAQYRKIKK